MIETFIPKVIFVTQNENSYVVTNHIQGLSGTLISPKIAVIHFCVRNATPVFLLTNGEIFGVLLWSLVFCNQVVHCSKKNLIFQVRNHSQNSQKEITTNINYG